MKAVLSVMLALCVVMSASPALAETIYLKSGTRVQGSIVKEDAQSFTVETKDGRRRILKKDVETAGNAAPLPAFIISMIFPGAGQIYVDNDWARGTAFIGVATLTSVAGFIIGGQIHYGSTSFDMVSALTGYELAGVAAGIDAAITAHNNENQPRYHIEYDTAAP